MQILFILNENMCKAQSKCISKEQALTNTGKIKARGYSGIHDTCRMTVADTGACIIVQHWYYKKVGTAAHSE